ncbi:MAG: diguanylate cyclase [Hylemonella sp.]|nr:diguanylate cyclase [Hylemonella sp.]
MPLPTQRHFESLLTGIDQGVQAHLAWNQRLMRCALLHESPGEDMMQPDAHRRCIFGKWFLTEQPALAGLDAQTTTELERQHRAMHDAVRALCTQSSQGQPASEPDLHAYELGQTAMMACLNTLRQKVGESVLQHDVLTGLPLRHGLSYAFDLRQKDAMRNGWPLHLAMVDVDHFKVVNDTWGHAVGDLALQHLSRLMSDCLRETDIVIRFGGEEFLFLLLGSGAEAVITRLLDEVRNHPMPMDNGQSLRMTVTAGITPVLGTDTLEAAVNRADHAMLEGKLHGRDRFVIAQAPSG